MKFFAYIFLLGITFVNCKAQLSNTKKINPQYKVNQPSRTFEMPEDLKEISGLTVSPDGNYLYAVSDEFGLIHLINKKTGERERQIRFNTDGDYEGIEVVDNKVFLVKSTGTLYEVNDLQGDSTTSKKTKFLLKKENNIEGLAYDPHNHRLLFACKGKHCFKENECESKHECQSKKAIYSLSLKDNEFVHEPAFEITLKATIEFLKNNKSEEELKKWKRYVAAESEKFAFNPSAIAIHPLTSNTYILSSKGKTFMVLNSEGKIIQMEKLNKKIHTQPEGIAFDKNGLMYISNEGKKEGIGKILVFNLES